MATQLVTSRPETPLDVFRSNLERRASEFQMALPSHITPEKFQRTVMTAVASNPDMLAADRQSLLLSCMKAAQDGLLPDGREAALVIFSSSVKDGQGKWNKVKLVQYMPMVYGVRKKILQSGEIKDIQTGVVYWQEVEANLFIYEEGSERMLRHKPLLNPTFAPTDDDICAAYSIATLADGSQSFEVMRRMDINKVRQASQTGALGKTKYNSNEVIPAKGPWADWFSEMARKTVLRRHSKTLPMSGDIIDVEAREMSIAAQSTAALLDSRDADEPTPSLPSRNDFNPETGEVIEQSEMADSEVQTGQADPQTGLTKHPAEAKADEIIAAAGKCATLIDLNALKEREAGNIGAMPDEIRPLVQGALNGADARLRGL